MKILHCHITIVLSMSVCFFMQPAKGQTISLEEMSKYTVLTKPALDSALNAKKFQEDSSYQGGRVGMHYSQTDSLQPGNKKRSILIITQNNYILYDTPDKKDYLLALSYLRQHKYKNIGSKYSKDRYATLSVTYRLKNNYVVLSTRPGQGADSETYKITWRTY